MNKYLFFSLLIIIIVFLFFYFNKINSHFKYKLNNKNYSLLVADSNSEWTRGLMNYKDISELKGVEGMIFIFPDRDFRSFWNENTYFDLDVYWLDGDKIVGKSYLPSIEKSKEVVIVDSKAKVNKVVELIRK